MGLLYSQLNTTVDISSFLLVGTYLVTDDNSSMNVQILMKNVSGNGNYIAYITRQINGVGSEYQSSPNTIIETAGVTSMWMPTILFPALKGDILKVYLKGTAFDTTTPNVITEFWSSTSNLDISTAVWSGLYAPIRTLTQNVESVIDSVTSGTNISIYSHTDVEFTLVHLNSIVGWEKLWFTVKKSNFNSDSESLLQFLITSPADSLKDGLVYVNRVPTTTDRANGAITVLSNTSIKVNLSSASSVLLQEEENIYYDIKAKISGKIRVISEGGAFNIITPTTKAIT